MDEAINVQEDLEDFGEENKLSESSFKTLSDPTIVVPTSSRINNNRQNDSEQDLKNINIEPLNDIKQQATSSRSGESRSAQTARKELNELPITHVTLSLNVTNKKTTSNIQWKHNFVRKKSSFSSCNNNNNNINKSNSNLAIQQSAR